MDDVYGCSSVAEDTTAWMQEVEHAGVVAEDVKSDRTHMRSIRDDASN